jgi:tRNA-2-methylthio-N6-dimethylallyladenosine synthase
MSRKCHGAVTERDVMAKKVFLETYGCQMNEADSELIAGIVTSSGLALAPSMTDADVILVNTCAVRDSAEQRVLGRLAEINKIKLRRPEVLLGVCGCMPKHIGERLTQKAPYVDLLVGPDSYRRLPDLIEAASGGSTVDLRLDKAEKYVGLDHVRKKEVSAWVTAMRGCDKFCTFCVVPYVRGRERSVPAEEILRQVEELAGEGNKEVTLLGQTVNSYSWKDVDFADLLLSVASVPGILRVRFTAPHPKDFSDKLIETIASSDAVCPHVHLPVQSGSDRVLQLMNREYTSFEYLDLVHTLRTTIPGIAITTDILVGFPGESEQDFQATYDMMQEVRFDASFTFKYSPRELTYAHKKYPDDVSEEEKGRRIREVIDLQESISVEINRALVGTEAEVLVEGHSKRGREQLFGKTGTFRTVVFPDNGVAAGSLVRVEVENATSHTLLGRAIP